MRRERRFGKVNVEISNICNLQCSFCPEVIRAKELMEVPLFKRVIEQVAPLTDQVCLHLMGDPLVHPKLGDLIEVAADHDVKLFIVTNGVLLRPSHVESLLHPTVRQVNFSLHSFSDNFGDRDPGPYLEKVFQFTERAAKDRPDLYVNYRLWNLQETRGGGEHNRSVLARVLERFRAEEVAELTRQALEIDVRAQKSIKLAGRLYLHFDTEFTWPGLELPLLSEVGTCKGLSDHFGVLVDGTVVPCCLDKEGAIPLGKIQDTDVLDILNSPRAQAILRGFRERRLVEELCKRCQYIERFQA